MSKGTPQFGYAVIGPVPTTASMKFAYDCLIFLAILT